jgi:methylated-DNA-[protein]-cysteine S-methyltransferase
MHEMTYTSPIGPLRLRADDAALLELTFGAGRDTGTDSAVLDAARLQLDEYFAGTRRTFGLPVRLSGSPWEERVWAELQTIPYGETASYGELAVRLGAPTSARAVGSANGRNPISIVVPCHRVIGSTGALTGYAWGVERKAALLDLERGVLPLAVA